MKIRPILCALFLLPLLSQAARAGMPKGLPLDVPRFLRVNDTVLERLQAISFFLATFVCCSLVVMLLWNYLRRDFTALPRLTFGKASAGVFLWGMLFIIVLTMISGARELMTPGAWEKQGVTYRLSERQAPASDAHPAEETP